MNHVYHLVWNRAMRLWQPVSELASQPRGGAASTGVYAPVRWQLHALAAALGLGLAGWGSAAQAGCTGPVASVVTCSGPANPLAPSFSNGADGLTVQIKPGGGLGVLAGVGGTAMRLSGKNVTVENRGTVDVYALSSQLTTLSSGLVLGADTMGSVSSGTYSVTNWGAIRGSGNDSDQSPLPNLTGMALAIRNGANGVTTVTNDGTIEAVALSNSSRNSADIAAVAIYGGGTATFTNSAGATINGRVAFESAGSSTGHLFTNAGAINGSVSLGANSKNTFVAEAGSRVNSADLTTGAITVASVPGLTFAAPGIVDGGAGGNNSLVFADTSNTGSASDVSSGTYANFNRLTVTGGTWSLSGAPFLIGSGNVALNGGQVLVNGDGLLGSGTISAAGGGIGASAAGVSIANNFTLATGGMAASSPNDFTLSGTLSGTGNLSVDGVGAITLTGVNTYTGGTTVSTGSTLKGDTNSLQGNIVNNGTVIFSSPASGIYAGAMSGGGTLTKQGAGTLTLGGALTHQGPLAIEAGSLAVGAGGTLSAQATVSLNPGATLNVSGGSNQEIAGLAGTGGAVLLGANALTLSGAMNNTYAGTLGGTGGLTKRGTGTQILNGSNTFTGGVWIAGGTLGLGPGGSLASGSSVRVDTSGVFDLTTAPSTTLDALNGNGGEVKLGSSMLTVGAGTYQGVISGGAGLNKNSAGTLTLNGANTYTGLTQVSAGALVVGGSSAYSTARLNGGVNVASGGSIGGFGQVNGAVNVESGGAVATGSGVGVFTVNGDLMMAQNSLLNYSLGAPGAGYSVQVNGNLTLSGAQLNVLDAGGYGVGVYRLFDYTGALITANGGIHNVLPGQTIQILTGPKQINLINSAAMELSLWNANRQATAGQFGGGSGIWSGSAPNWTDPTAAVTSVRTPADAFAFFGGQSGTVTVDSIAGAVQAKGVQFGSDGYRVNGDALNLVAPSAGALSEVRVGDGSQASAGWTATFDNEVAGNGLNKTGAGTLVLNGANTYAQTTRLSAGTLSVSSDANLGATQAALDFQGGTLRVTGTSMLGTARAITMGTLGGGLDIASAGNIFSLSQAISGGGGLTKLGAGTLVLTGANTYLGTTTVAGGKLQVGNGSTVGSIAGNAAIQSGGTLAFNRTDRVVYGGVISGTGDLRHDGTGTLVLTGDNTFTGTTTITTGGLQVGDGATGGTLGGTVINNGSLAFDRATDSVFGGTFAGIGSVFKQGAGTLSVTGDSSAYIGLTLVSAGGLQIDGKLGGTVLALSSGTTVSGVGSVNQLTIGSGATLSPGNATTPFGRLNVLGNLNLMPGAAYRVAAAADGQHSSVNVAGIANLAGSVLHMGQNGSYAPSTTYTILTAGGGVQGRFDGVSSNLAFLTPSLAYGSNQVDLSVQLKQVPDTGTGNGGDGGTRPIQFADAAVTGNQRAVARALQSLPANSALYLRVLNLPNGAPIDVFNGLSGETHATTVAVAQGMANTFVQIPMNRLRANLGAGMLPGVPTAQLGLGNAASLPQSAAQPLWAQVFGNWTSLGGDGNAAKTTQSDSGVSAGGDVAVGGGWRLGGAVGYANSRSNTGDRASSSQADSYSVTVYGGKAFDAGNAKLNLSLGASYTWHDMKTQRYADAAGLPQTLKADYDGNTTQVFGELGYAMPLTDRVTLEPFVGAGFSSLRTDGFTESGGDAALRGDAGRNNVTTTTLGLHARSAFDSAGAQGQLHGTLGWRHAFGDVDPASTMSFVQGGQSFTTNGVPIARDAAVVELGVNMAVSKRTTVGVIYGGQFGEGNQQHSGTLDVRYRF